MAHNAWPRLTTEYGEELSPTLLVTWASGEAPLRFCGDSWCTGTCGLPALVLPATHPEGHEQKAYSSMVAYGPVFQSWRVAWVGEKREVPEEHRSSVEKRYWV